MALYPGIRTKVAATTSGLVDFGIGSAPDTSFNDFSGVPDGSTVDYIAFTSTEFEAGTGVYTASGPTLSRDTIDDSSNSGAKVNFGSSPTIAITFLPKRIADIIFADTHGIYDENGNEQLIFHTTVSAVNYLTIFNATSFNSPGFQAVANGGDIGEGNATGLSFNVAGSMSNRQAFVFNTGSGTNPAVVFYNNSSGDTGSAFVIQHDSASPAINDVTGKLIFRGQDDGGFQVNEYSSFSNTILDPTDGSEDGLLAFNAIAGGSLAQQLGINAGVVVGSGTTFPGVGNLAFADGHGIFDGAGNEQVLFTQTSGAVNYLNITNAATGNAPTLSAAGSDANVGLAFSIQGDLGDPNEAFSFNMGSADYPLFSLNGFSSGGGGPYIRTYAQSASPATGDEIAGWEFDGKDSAANRTAYGQIVVKILDATNGSEDSSFSYQTAVAGSFFQHQFDIGNGVVVGNGSSITYPGTGNLGFATGKGIFDGAGNEQLLFGQIASATSYLNLTNSATNWPELAAAGDNSSVNMRLSAKAPIPVYLDIAASAATALDGWNDFFRFQLGGGFAAKLTQTDAATSFGPTEIFYHNSASPAAGDQVFTWIAYVNNDAASPVSGAEFLIKLDDPTAGSEDGHFEFRARQAGSSNTQLGIASGVVIGSGSTFPGDGNLAFATGKGIFDDAGNEQVLFTKTASAVNYLEITNAAAGNDVGIYAKGDDTGLGIDFYAQNSGVPIQRMSLAGAAATGFDGWADQIYFPMGGTNGDAVLFETPATGAFGINHITYANSSSPAVADEVFSIWMYGKDSTDQRNVYGRITTRILDTTNISEDGEMLLEVCVNGQMPGYGTFKNCALSLSDGVIVGGPGGTYPGFGNLKVGDGSAGTGVINSPYASVAVHAMAGGI
jgi:hypothetical protein